MSVGARKWTTSMAILGLIALALLVVAPLLLIALGARFSVIFYFLAVGWKDLTNGDDGMPFSIPPVFVFDGLELKLYDLTFQYYFVLVVVGLCYLLLWALLRSPLGLAFRSVRDNDRRAG